MPQTRQRKDDSLHPAIHALIHSRDQRLDALILEYDALASIVHAHQLCAAGYVTKAEFKQLKDVLLTIADRAHEDTPKGEELRGSSHDVIDRVLHQKLKHLGDRLQLGRSRYNQVSTALRLFAKEELFCLRALLQDIARGFLVLAEKHATDPMPGFIHGRTAEVTSIGHFFAAYAEVFLEEDSMLPAVMDKFDACSLGGGTSYGSTIITDRQQTADLLGFARVHNNTLALQLMRGRMEATILSALSTILIICSRLAQDLIVFSSPVYEFFSFPDTIFSQEKALAKKLNPVILEIIRGSSGLMQGYLMQVLSVQQGLQAGYQRDLQLTKQPFMEGIQMARHILEVIPLLLASLTVHTDTARRAASNPQLFVNDLVSSLVITKGYPLEVARAKISENYNQASFRSTLAVADLPDFNPSRHIAAASAHGMPGNLHLAPAHAQLAASAENTATAHQAFTAALAAIRKL